MVYWKRDKLVSLSIVEYQDSLQNPEMDHPISNFPFLITVLGYMENYGDFRAIFPAATLVDYFKEICDSGFRFRFPGSSFRLFRSNGYFLFAFFPKLIEVSTNCCHPRNFLQNL